MAESPESGPVMQPRSLNSVSDLSITSSEKAEIDTSAPFESVREAATRFGGFGFWKPSGNKVPEPSQENVKESNLVSLEEQTANLENILIAKELETLKVLKELKATKATVEELNLKLQQKEAYEKEILRKEADKENYGRVHSLIKPAGVILKDLSQAKLNLCRTTEDLAGIRASVEVLNKKLEDEKAALEKTRERVKQKSLNVSSLEEEVKDIEVKLRFATESETRKNNSLENVSEISKEVQILECEAQEFKKTGEDARSAVVKAIAEIEQTRDMIKTAKIRLVAARKMKEAARVAEAIAIADIEAITRSKSTEDMTTISTEHYAALTREARDAEEKARKRVEDAMYKVNEANVSKTELLKKVEEASHDIKTRKGELEEAMERVNAANAIKLEVEEELRNWRSENGQRRRSSSVNNTAKFKNPCLQQSRRETRLLDVNGLNLTYDANGLSSLGHVLKPTMSIGQILSRKLLLEEDREENVVRTVRRKVSLGQMLGKKKNGEEEEGKGKEKGKRVIMSKKRKNFGFAKISVLLNKKKKKKK